MIKKTARTAKLELLQTDPSEVVKIAALVRQIPELQNKISFDNPQQYLQSLALVQPKTKYNLVPKVVHELNNLEFATALAQGYKMVFGSLPTLEVLGAGWAQAVLETGQKPTRLPCYNVGNIKAVKGWIESGKPFFVEGTIEVDKQGKSYKEHGTKWRAYGSAAEGAAGYWRLLKNYGKVLDWMQAGEPESAGMVLGQKGYYTANRVEYAGKMGILYRQFWRELAPQLKGLASNPKVMNEPKPEIKDERFEKKESTPPPEDTKTEEVATNEADQLIDFLFSSEVRVLVKNAEKAKQLASVMKLALNIETELKRHTIYCKAKGMSQYKLAQALEALCSCCGKYANFDYEVQL